MADMLNSIDISARGLTVQRQKMNTVAENMANAETTATREGGPYRRKRVLVEAEQVPGGFSGELQRANTKLATTHGSHRQGKVTQIGHRQQLTAADPEVVQDPASSFRLVYDPSHPHADTDGYVKMPDVDIVTEMVDMMLASRAYEANTSAISTAKKMINDALEI